MRKPLYSILCVAILCVGLALDSVSSALATEQLPPEARETLRLIDANGPFPYQRDGITFQNRERRLPEQPSGYYREYTVPTPGSKDRGARRIVAGGQPPTVFYFTADHYQTFRQIRR
ncbi:MAG: ribonuclease [Rhodocyclales bacterium]|nr:ribonuclease [Rhodocyclales bacterium]